MSDQEKHLDNLRMVCIFFVVSVLGITGVGVSGIAAPEKSYDDIAMIIPLLLILGISEFVLGPILGKFLLASAKKDASANKSEAELLFVPTIIMFAIFESAAIFGLLATIIGGPVWICILLSAGALVSMACNWPRVTG